jgi:diguanylate cyclase (GGDEF)-like protein
MSMNITGPVSEIESELSLAALAAARGLSPGVWTQALVSFVDARGGAMAVKDIVTGRYVHADHRLSGFFGRSVEALIGCTDAELFGPDLASPLRAADLTTATLGQPHTCEHRLERDRQRRDFSVTRIVLASGDVSPSRYLGAVWLEVTEQRRREGQLTAALQQIEQQQLVAETLRREVRDAPLRDDATGLFQDGHFDDQLRREVDLSTREHREFSLVAIALDPPQEAETALGASARHRVLESIGALLRANTRAMDSSCRLGDGRFAVLLSGVGLATAHARMEGLRRQCATQIVVQDGRDFGFSVSMGVASFPHTAHTRDELVQAADQALADAHRRGGNHVTLASIRFDALE